MRDLNDPYNIYRYYIFCRIRTVVSIFVVPLRMSVSDTAAIMRRRRIKRESGENPGQSRCCDVRLRRVRNTISTIYATAAACGREGVGIGTSQKTCRRRKIATCEGQDNLTLPRPAYRDEPMPRRVIPNPFRIVIPPPVRAAAVRRSAKIHFNIKPFIAMKTTITGAAYHAPAVRELHVSLEHGFATSAFSGSTGNENYGYENENWD